MKNIIWIFVFGVLVSCNSNKDKDTDTKSEGYDMYEPSEMSMLMNEMYDYNLEIKKQIIEGEIPTAFPLDFLKIHSAELSDFKQRNSTFESFSKVFIEAEKEVFNAESTVNIEDRFNNAVGICISCHQTECTGPIPRIKKLLIK